MFAAFDVSTNTMYLVVRVVQGENLFLCQYNYSYTLDGDGIYTFNPLAADANAQAIRPFMADILAYLQEDSFKSEFVGGTEALTGGFFSQERPEFSFSGELTN
jgi:hypothetical protein